MSSSFYLIIFCTLAAASLLAVSVVNEREERQRALKQRQRQLRFKVQELEELVLKIDQLTESRLAAKLLNEETLETILAMKSVDPDAGYLNALHQTALARHESLSEEAAQEPPHAESHHAEDHYRKPALDRLQSSDAHMARAKKTIREAAAILRRQHRRNKIPAAEMSLLMLELSWASLMIEVISFIGQGHRCMRRRELFTAHAFYKKAQQALIQSSHPDPRRKQFITELTELLHGSRSSISLRLMPESYLNPDASADSQLLDLPTSTDRSGPVSASLSEPEYSITGLEAWQA